MNTDQDPRGLAAALELAIIESGDRVLPFFRFAHLPIALQTTSGWFAECAVRCVAGIAPSAERTVALRKLLEGKDAAVRAMLPTTGPSDAVT